MHLKLTSLSDCNVTEGEFWEVSYLKGYQEFDEIKNNTNDIS